MVSLGEIYSWRKCCGQRWHDSTGLAFKSFGKSAAELEMTTNVKEDTLFIKSYQRASHATEKPFVHSRLHCHLKELTAVQLQQPPGLLSAIKYF